MFCVTKPSMILDQISSYSSAASNESGSLVAITLPRRLRETPGTMLVRRPWKPSVSGFLYSPKSEGIRKLHWPSIDLLAARLAMIRKLGKTLAASVALNESEKSTTRFCGGRRVAIQARKSATFRSPRYWLLYPSVISRAHV